MKQPDRSSSDPSPSVEAIRQRLKAYEALQTDVAAFHSYSQSLNARWLDISYLLGVITAKDAEIVELRTKGIRE